MHILTPKNAHLIRTTNAKQKLIVCNEKFLELSQCTLVQCPSLLVLELACVQAVGMGGWDEAELEGTFLSSATTFLSSATPFVLLTCNVCVFLVVGACSRTAG